MKAMRRVNSGKVIGSRRGRAFFYNDACFVAKSVLGDFLVFRKGNSRLIGRIVETEAYLGLKDDASHGFLGKKTFRNKVLYEKGGLIYVYSIYGIYYCFNVVVSMKESPQSVFIRALEPIEGIEAMREKRNRAKDLTNGPCRWTMAFGIDKSFSGKDIISGEIFILKGRKKEFNIVKAPRVGIDYASDSKDKPWRYYIEGSRWVSKRK